MSKKLYKRKVWGGFVDGRLDMPYMDDGFVEFGVGSNGWGKRFALFTSQDRARKQYQDVRPIEIREIPTSTDAAALEGKEP